MADNSFKPYTIEERLIAFWEKVDRSGGPAACWNWRGAITAKWGYGCFSLGGNVVRGAHKLAWLFTNGDPKGLCVCHRCDNRLCCNPAHMFLGTKQDNNDDKIAKGRQYTKLTEADVRAIRARFAGIGKKAPKGLNLELALKYGVTDKTICVIRHGKKWRHVV